MYDAAKPLGRWTIDYCAIKMNNKIDSSNEDHCGPCGQYGLTKLQSKAELLNSRVVFDQKSSKGTL